MVMGTNYHCFDLFACNLAVSEFFYGAPNCLDFFPCLQSYVYCLNM